VLRTAARRSTDLVARYGGEEFVILLPGIDVNTAADIAEVLRKTIEARAEPHPAAGMGGPGVITASFGVAAAIPRAPQEPESLLRRADVALYQAKDSGRNTVAIDTTALA
jgi:diguanylate cyclase (GGDEF)-like protein